MDAALKEISRRLLGRMPSEPKWLGKPMTAREQDAWGCTARFLGARLQVSTEEVANTMGHEGRSPDMSPQAGAAFCAVLDEVAKEDIGARPVSEAARLSHGPYVSPTESVLLAAATGLASRRERRPSTTRNVIGDSLDRWRVEKLGLEATPSESSFTSKSGHSEKGHSDCTTNVFVGVFAWGTFALFTLGAFVLLMLWATMEEERTGAFVSTFFVCSIASLCYFAKATHMHEVRINGSMVPIARYIDWLTTTPLLMYELCHLAHASTSMTLMLVGCDILMISTGIFSACLDRNREYRMMAFWFAASTIFYIIMICIINIRIANGPVMERPAEVQELFTYLKVLTSVVWSFYPIVVLLGRAQCHLISRNTEDVALMVLDLIAKLGVEGLIVAYAGFIMEPADSSGSSSGS